MTDNSHNEDRTSEEQSENSGDKGKEEMPPEEPQDMSLDEQAHLEPPNDVESQTDDFKATAEIGDDGRINLNINAKTDKLNMFLPKPEEVQPDKLKLDPEFFPDRDETNFRNPPAMNIVVQVIGSRGDIQPFIALGKELQKYGHRIRIATHPTFKEFVEDVGLEFFSIGGDPAELMSYMVRNPSLIPRFESLRSGEIGKRRKMMYEMIEGCWRSCIEGDFIADAIIANPPSFAHVHCAERLSIPLWIVFTMPWSPTMTFSHPLANIQSSNAEPRVTNYLSYILVEALTWQGLGDLVNRFRRRTLGLDEIAFTMGICLLNTLKVPHTYTWSPSLIPKPLNWGDEINISGFFFHSQPNYKPAPDLEQFLSSGDPPIYIGFGSIVLDDPTSLTNLLLSTLTTLPKINFLISKGWGGLTIANPPKNIFFLENVPHDWLFPKVRAVIHHGGAGTTAIGLKCGKPTFIVPFFGDQGFWGDMVFRAGAGPEPIPFKELDGNKLKEGIKVLLEDGVRMKAEEVGKKIRRENGVERAVEGFYSLLPLMRMRCLVLGQRVAVWEVSSGRGVSGVVAGLLERERKLDLRKMKLLRYKEYDTENQQWDPVTGSISAAIGSGVDLGRGLAKLPTNPPGGVIDLTTFPLKATSEMNVSLQQGFQNIPKLYGDTNVRKGGKVTGIGSGLIEAAKGFTYGLGDAGRSVIEQPILGAQKEGGMGLIKGAAKGVAGMYAKGYGACYAVPARITQGVWKEVQNVLHMKQDDMIIGQRRKEAREAAKTVDAKTKDEILKRWKELDITVKYNE